VPESSGAVDLPASSDRRYSLTADRRSSRPRTDFDQFLDRIDHPILTREAEAEVGRRITEGRTAGEALADTTCPAERARLEGRIRVGEQAAAYLTEHSLRFLRRRVRDWADHPHVADLFQEGWIALRAAADRFDPSFGVRFVTFAAPSVKAAFSRAHRRLGDTVYVGERRHDDVRRWKKTKAKLTERLERVPAAVELAEELGWTVEHLRKAEAAAEVSVAGIDADGSIGGSWRAWGRAYPVDPTDTIGAVEDRQYLTSLLARLDDRRRLVLALRFGLDGDGPRTQAEIGAVIGVTRARAGVLEATALAELRHPSAVDLAA